MSGYFTSASGAVSAAPAWTTAGTIDTYGGSASSGGLSLTVNSSAATGNWTAGLNSGVLSLLTSNTRGPGFLTLSFSLSASSPYPIRVRIESYNAASVRTGGLTSLIFPAAGDFYQRYALDLDKMTADGAGTFTVTDPKVRIFFEMDSTANGTGWPAGVAHSLKVDNVNYSTPKYYVKPASIGGSNSNNGLTEATAYATVQQAINQTFTGDNIIAIMEDATPGGDDYVESNVNFEMVNIVKPGAPNAWIVFKNYPGHAPVMKSSGWQTFRIRNNTTTSAAYIEIRGITVRGHSYIDANGDRQTPYAQYISGAADSRTNGGGISVSSDSAVTNPPHNVRVADCIVEYIAGGCGSSGDRITFENNLIRNNGWWQRYAGSGISVGFATDCETNANPAAPTYRRLIRNNIVYGNECMVPWNRGTSNNYSDGNGIILDSDTAGYTGKTLVQNNLVFNNGGSGIHVLKCSNVDLVHNTAYFNSASTPLAYGQIFTQSFSNTAGQWVKNVRMTNNIMVAQRNPTGVNSYLYNESATSVAAADPTTITHNRNIYVGGDNTPSLTGANLSDNTDLGRAYDPANLFVNPSINPDVADFRLRAAAVSARNYGFAVGYRGVLDLVSTPRFLTGTTDTGVYQTPANTTYPPVFSPKSGNYAVTQNVTLVSDTAGATFVYTTNGTIPTVDASGVATNGTLYTGTAIPVSTTTTLKAIAWKSGLSTAAPSSVRYTFQDLSAVPVTLALQYASGTYSGTVFAQPLTRTPGALMRYTTNATNPTPTTGTPQAAAAVTVTDYAEVRYIASKAGRANSPVLAGIYTVRASTGNLSDGTALITIGANNIRFVRFHPTNGFSAAFLYARINGLTGNYRAAIYDDTAGVPTNRLAVSSLVTNPATGWTAFPLAARVTLAVKDSSNADKYYWLAIWSDNASAGIYSTPTGGTVNEAAVTFTTATTNNSNWPSPVVNPAVVAGTANYAIYAANQPPNLAPVVAAGPDQTIALAATATLAGSASDDGVPVAPGTLTTTWTQVSGPGTATFANPASAATSATFSANGTYVLRLTARDALLVASDEVTISVVASTGGPIDPSPPAGVVQDRFSDGLGNSFPQQYPGVSGDGWANAWASSTNISATVPGTPPLNGGGNYLNVARTAGTSGVEGVYRQWSSATRPPDQFARLAFVVRLNSATTVFNTAGDNVGFSARPTAGATSGPDSTFFIRAFGGAAGSLQAREWGVYNGDGVTGTGAGAYNVSRFTPTGMLCVPGDVYAFTIDLFGATGAGSTGGKANGTYDVSITNLTTGQTATVFGSRYRSAAYLSGTYLSFFTQQDNAADGISFSVDTIEMTSLATTTTALSASVNPASFGQLVSFTATVGSSGGIPSGSVTFLDGATVLGIDALDNSGVATFSTSALVVGVHAITALYPATTTFTASASTALNLTVGSAVTTTLNSSANPSVVGSPVTFTANLESEIDILPATITFLDGATVVGTGTLDATGVATLDLGSLSVGVHFITASYAGDASHSSSVSTALGQIVQLPDGTTRARAVNSAGPALGIAGFEADAGFTASTPTSTSATINVSGEPNAAPAAVYQTERYGRNFTYTFNGLIPSGAYLVRLHFSENYWGLGGRPGPGQRVFNVTINGAPRLNAFEIYTAAGAPNKAVVRAFDAAADVSGQLIVGFAGAAGSPDSNALVDGLEIYTVTPMDAWRVENFTAAQLDSPSISGLAADPDADNMNNLLERALDSDPLASSPEDLPTAGFNEFGSLALAFFRGCGDLNYLVQGSDDLATWSTIATNPGVVGQNIIQPDNASPNASPRFLRLKVTSP